MHDKISAHVIHTLEPPRTTHPSAWANVWRIAELEVALENERRAIEEREAAAISGERWNGWHCVADADWNDTPATAERPALMNVSGTAVKVYSAPVLYPSFTSLPQWVIGKPVHRGNVYNDPTFNKPRF